MLLTALFRIDRRTETNLIIVKIVKLCARTVQQDCTQLVAFRADAEVAAPEYRDVFLHAGLQWKPLLAADGLNIRKSFTSQYILIQIKDFLFICVHN